MGNLKRVMISLPNQLLQEVDGYVKKAVETAVNLSEKP